MKKFSRQLLVVLMLVSLVLPLIPAFAAPTSLSQNDMRLITGGKLSLDCSAVAAAAEAFCIIGGGSPGVCSWVYNLAYVGCLISKLI